MSDDWDNDDWEQEQETDVQASNGGGDWDDWEVEPVQEPEPVQTTKPKASESKSVPKVKKLTLKEKLKLKEVEEEQAKAQKAAEARAAAANVAPMTKEEERNAMMAAEARIASDLFGDVQSTPSTSATPVQTGNSETNARAAALAASTGLFDGYDGIAPVNVPEEKTGPTAAPSVLDALDLNDPNIIPQFVNELSRKIKDYNNSANAALLLKEILNQICPLMKLDHVQEVLRVVTVQKNTAADKERSKKKSNKKQHLAKDHSDDIYQDFF